jgi:hypothetical protein
VTFYDDGVKIWEHFALNFGDNELAVASWQYTHSHFLFHKGTFDKNNMAIVPQPPYFSLFLPIKLKLKGCNFDTTEVIEAESQAVLNTLLGCI